MSANKIVNLVEKLRQDTIDYDQGYTQNYFSVTRRLKQAADCIESLQTEVDGMRSNWYKCAENYQQKCRDIAELEVELEKNNGCFWCSGDVPLNNVKINGVAVNISCCPMCGKQLEVEHI